MTWIKTGTWKGRRPAGEKTLVSSIEYTLKVDGELSDITVSSNKYEVPHSGDNGFWNYTEYEVAEGDEVLKVRHSLKDAKEWAEKHMNVMQ